MAIRPNPFSNENQTLQRVAKNVAFGFILGKTPLARVSITDLDSFEKKTVQFNPTTLTERVQVKEMPKASIKPNGR